MFCGKINAVTFTIHELTFFQQHRMSNYQFLHSVAIVEFHEVWKTIWVLRILRQCTYCADCTRRPCCFDGWLIPEYWIVVRLKLDSLIWKLDVPCAVVILAWSLSSAIQYMNWAGSKGWYMTDYPADKTARRPFFLLSLDFFVRQTLRAFIKNLVRFCYLILLYKWIPAALDASFLAFPNPDDDLYRVQTGAVYIQE